jgi:ribosome-binding factor A
MAREFGRTERVADYLRQELARLLQAELRDPRVGMVSVNEVEVSRDLAYAKVFVTFMDRDSEQEAREQLEVLNGAAGFLRTQVAHDARMRTVPKLRFVFDASVTRGRRLSDLIDRALADDARRHPAAEPGGEE